MTPAVEFHLHDPAATGARNVLEVLVEAAHGAERGGGIFAFASRAGIDMLLGDEELQPLLSGGGFELIVGVDSVTDTRALDRLTELSRRRPGLSARALVHGRGGIFHPKLCWFAAGERLRLVVGSGNLTLGGLARNTEASLATVLSGADAVESEAAIRAWTERWDDYLMAPDSPQAQARAAENSGSERSLRRRMPQEGEEPAVEDAPPAEPGAEVLALDIPRNDPNRTQLDIGMAQFRSFFGGEPGQQRRILIQPVDGVGQLGEVERPRKLIETRSRNYRFEAGAGHRRPYPQEGRPIAVFARGGDGIFRYQLFWPEDPGHAEADAFLTSLAGREVGGKMRRETGTVGGLRAAWPEAPLLAALG